MNPEEVRFVLQIGFRFYHILCRMEDLDEGQNSMVASTGQCSGRVCYNSTYSLYCCPYDIENDFMICVSYFVNILIGLVEGYVLGTGQSPLHLTLWRTRSFQRQLDLSWKYTGKLQLLRVDYSFTYPTLSIPGTAG